jgi:hypothetical protein
MKTVQQLVAVSLLALTGIAAVAGCAAPAVPAPADDETAGADADQTAKLPPSKKKTTTNDDGNNSSSATPTPDTTPAPAPNPAPTPTPTPTPGGNPEQCMDQCAATGPGAQYWSCSAVCQDQQCDDNCWNQSCAQNEQACGSALDACANQCGYKPGQP